MRKFFDIGELSNAGQFCRVMRGSKLLSGVPSKEHTIYSLRHSFNDRLIAAEAPDSLIDSLMGHKTYKPKHGKGPNLDLKLKYLQQIAFKPPTLV
jgi:integrase